MTATSVQEAKLAHKIFRSYVRQHRDCRKCGTVAENERCKVGSKAVRTGEMAYTEGTKSVSRVRWKNVIPAACFRLP